MNRKAMTLSYALSILFFIALSSFPHSANCQELHIAVSYDIPPYVTNAGTQGLQLDIFKKAMENKGYSFATLQAPYERLEVAVLNMDMDGSMSVMKKINDGTYYSDDFIAFKNYAITKKESGLTINSIADLKGKTILAWQRAHKDLGQEFEEMFSPTNTEKHATQYHEIPIQKNQVDMFLKGRAEVIIIDENIFKVFVQKLTSCKNLNTSFIYHDIFPEKTTFTMNFKEKHVRDDFNMGLDQIRRDGTYQAILKRYIPHYSRL